MPYFLAIIVLAGFTFANTQNPRSAKSVAFYYLIVLFFALVIGLRGNEDEYTRVFVLVKELSNFFSIENYVVVEKGVLFGLIASLIHTLGLNSQALLLSFALFSLLFHAYYFRRFTALYGIAFLLYAVHAMIFHDWVGIRMGVASALVLPAIEFAEKSERKKFLLVVLISSMIHYVGILSLLVYPARNKIRPSFLLIALIASIGLLSTGALSSVMQAMGEAGFLPSIVFSYLNYDTYVYDAGLSHFKTMQQILTCLFIIYLISTRRIELPAHFHIIFNVYVLSTLMYINFNQLALFAFRFGGHFYVVEPILITYLVYFYRPREVVAVILISGALIIGYVNYVLLARVDPYIFLVDQAQYAGYN